jgi:hypothetical protein
MPVVAGLGEVHAIHGQRRLGPGGRARRGDDRLAGGEQERRVPGASPERPARRDRGQRAGGAIATMSTGPDGGQAAGSTDSQSAAPAASASETAAMRLA